MEKSVQTQTDIDEAVYNFVDQAADKMLSVLVENKCTILATEAVLRCLRKKIYEEARLTFGTRKTIEKEQ